MTVGPLESGRTHVFTVGGFLRLMQSTIEDEIGRVRVEGEISDFKQAVSGHCYFSLKDGSARIACVLFAGAAQKVSRRSSLGDGRMVEVEADAAIYPARGQLQLIVRQVIFGGRGELLLRFEQLKRKLEAEGLFASERKRPLPLLPRRIGIVTSPSGAAIRDILRIFGDRFANLYVLVAPVRVQGEGAGREIADAIERLNRRGGFDVLIVGRGGGSIEDLWAFNEEVVARAVAGSLTPVVSAVGHEVDITLSDLAADLRAPTPSAAAEMVIGRKKDFMHQVDRARQGMIRALSSRLREYKARLSAVAGARVLRDPKQVIFIHRQSLDGLAGRSLESLRARGDQERRRRAAAASGLCRPRNLDTGIRRARVDALGLRLGHVMGEAVERGSRRLQAAGRQLAAADPESLLRRGYSMAFDGHGCLVRSASRLGPGDRFTLRLADGKVESRVEASASDPDAASP